MDNNELTLIKKYNQIESIEYIKNKYGTDLWIQVAGKSTLPNGSDATFWVAMLGKEKIGDALKCAGWELRIGDGKPGFISYHTKKQHNVEYERLCDLYDVEPLVYARNFNGIKDDYYEVVEEFRLLNNLYHDTQTNTFLAIKDTGDTEEVIRIKDDSVFINRRYLLRYASAKQMAIALYFSVDVCFKHTDENELGIINLNLNISDDIVADIWGGSGGLYGNGEYSSRLEGKKILMPLLVEKCGYSPYDKKDETKYEDFIIGVDKNGEEIKNTCNPDKLANYFGKNPDAPHYLTPVFFKRSVLNKYVEDHGKFLVSDGGISCGSLWRLRIDNHSTDYVSVYLGDLGNDILFEEQNYWKSFNILIDGKISDVKIKRDFMAQATDPEISDLKFKLTFADTIKKWRTELGWDLFIPLNKNDQHNFNKIFLPINNTQAEFDNLILSLTKVIIDSLNEKEIDKLINRDEELKGGISKLERLCTKMNVTNYKVHIDFLRILQQLRSSSTAHRKGSKYESIAKKFCIGEKSFTCIFDDILKQSINFLSFISLLATLIKNKQ